MTSIVQDETNGEAAWDGHADVLSIYQEMRAS